MDKIPAVILARGGSKGIPGKNLKEVGGHSLIARAVTAANESKLGPVYVYSDSDEILDEAERHGGTCVERPENVSGDATTSEETMEAFINQVDPDGAYQAFALQQCTTPFIRPEHLTRAYDLMVGDSDVDSVLTASRFEHFLGYEVFDRPETFVPVTPYRDLRQKMDSVMWMENGGVYIATRNLWLAGKRIGSNCLVVEMDSWESIEIDEPIDLEIAKRIAPCLSR